MTPYQKSQRSAAYRPDIDGLRAVAVLAVLLYHLGVPMVTGGFVGVDVFFVISGYLITNKIKGEIEAGDFTFSGFYLGRARRLFPALFVMLAVSSAFAAAILPPDLLAEFAGSLIYTIAWLSNVYFYFVSGYFGAAAESQPLLHTWSLSVEEQFYLIWPLSLFILLRSRRTLVTLTCIGLASVASLLAAELWLSIDATAAFYLLPFRIVEFGIGAGLVWLRPLTSRIGREVLLAVGLAIVVASVLTFTDSTRFPGLSALVPCIGAAVVIYAGQARYMGLALRNPASVWVGKISYSLYLAHWPVIVFYSYGRVSALQPIDQAIIAAMAFALAAASFYLVEKPFRRGTMLKDLQGAGLAFGFVSAALVLVVPMATIWGSGGWPSRYSPETLQLLAAATPHESEGPAPEVAAADATFRVLVVGDSHIVTIQAALTRFLEGSGTSITVMQGCFPAVGIKQFLDGVSQPFCEKFGAELAATLVKFDAVVFAARWSLYDWTVRDAMEAKLKFDTYVLARSDDTAEIALQPGRSLQVMRQQLEATVRIAAAAGVPVLLVGEAPPLGIDLRPCIAKGNPKDCKPLHDRVAARDRVIRSAKVLQEIEAAVPKVVFLNTFAQLCPKAEAVCPTFFDDVFLYSDDDHLSKVGSFAIEPLLAGQLKRFVALIPHWPATVAGD